MNAIKPRREPLTRARVVSQAMDIADEGGISALSMRRLARQLGYEVMALYNHVANKGELLSLMVDAVATEIDDPPSGSEPLEAVRALANSTHATLQRRPWAPELWLQHLPGPARTQLMERLLRLLEASGLSPKIAHHGFHAVNNHVLGYTLQELGMTLADEDPSAKAAEYLAEISTGAYPLMAAHVRQHLTGDTDSSFELVLDLILDGLVRLNRSSPG